MQKIFDFLNILRHVIGHLFDNQIINRILDVVEHVDGCSVSTRVNVGF